MIQKLSFLFFLISVFLVNAQPTPLEDVLIAYSKERNAKKEAMSLSRVASSFAVSPKNADTRLELRQLQNFGSRLDSAKAIVNLENYLLANRGYIKDSLQILIVKLVAIRELDEKQLLTKDIKDHGAYYMALLSEFKNSELDPRTYIFLERQVFQIHHEQLEKKYTTSLWANIIGFVFLLGLIFLIFQYRKRYIKVPSVLLSKQERTIKTLILEGKSNKEIASELFISISTVKTHISDIYSKLQVSGRKELLLKE